MTRGGAVANARCVRKLLPAELRHWRDGLLDPRKASTVNRTLKCLKAAFNLAAAHDPRIGNAAVWRSALASLPDAHTARHVGLPERDVRAGPDGAVYLATDSANGRILRVRPAD